MQHAFNCLQMVRFASRVLIDSNDSPFYANNNKLRAWAESVANKRFAIKSSIKRTPLKTIIERARIRCHLKRRDATRRQTLYTSAWWFHQSPVEHSTSRQIVKWHSILRQRYHHKEAGVNRERAPGIRSGVSPRTGFMTSLCFRTRGRAECSFSHQK